MLLLSIYHAMMCSQANFINFMCRRKKLKSRWPNPAIITHQPPINLYCEMKSSDFLLQFNLWNFINSKMFQTTLFPDKSLDHQFCRKYCINFHLISVAGIELVCRRYFAICLKFVAICCSFCKSVALDKLLIFFFFNIYFSKVKTYLRFFWFPKKFYVFWFPNIILEYSVACKGKNFVHAMHLPKILENTQSPYCKCLEYFSSK